MHAPQSHAATPLRGGGRGWGTAVRNRRRQDELQRAGAADVEPFPSNDGGGWQMTISQRRIRMKMMMRAEVFP